MPDVGEDLLRLVERLFPLPRSLTGDGVRATLAVLAEDLPLTVTEVPSGTQVLDWTVPREWVVREAHVTDPSGRRVVDVADGPLHLVGHSTPFRGCLSREELLGHLHSLPDRPALTPYRTTYYADAWGFCLPHERVEALMDGDYEVVVDTELIEGSLILGEVVVPGRTEEELLFSAHVCHPAQANDNLSGVVVAAALARRLLDAPTPRHTIRFVFAPGTLGALAWLALHRHDVVPRLRAGLVLAGLGDASPPTYKRSRRADSAIDRAMEHVLSGVAGSTLLDFTPYGYDERQYCSPGFDLGVGRLGRAEPSSYPEYHTSADDPGFVSAASLAESLRLLTRVVDVLERNRTLVNLAPYGEPQLGRRGLYRNTGALPVDSQAREMALLWLMSLSDGTTSLLEIARRAGLSFAAVADAAAALEGVGLLGAPPVGGSGLQPAGKVVE